MGIRTTSYPVAMGFASASQVVPDADRPPLMRALAQTANLYGSDAAIEVRDCAATDWSQDPSVQPDLFTFGFDTVDLSGLEALQDACRQIAARGTITDDLADTIRGALLGAELQTSAGRTLTVRYLADEGMIMRSAGPNRLAVVGPRAHGMNGHGSAKSVHSDQDVFGTPLVQLMDGKAPSLFRHDSPDGCNHEASLMLLNVWIPLHQITQPLVFADGRSIDRLRHQLRFGLATETFLERDDDQNVNDIWTFLYDPGQRWYFRSAMDHRSAYVFNTLSTPHGAAVLPGEDVAEQCYLALEAVESAVERCDPATVLAAAETAVGLRVPDGTTPALGQAIEAMRDLLDEAASDAPSIRGERADRWLAAARAARQQVVRRSLELRMVVSVEP